MSIFVDTSAFLAVLNKDDHFHFDAKKTWEEINRSEELLICSNYILVETIALLQHRFGVEAIRIFEQDIQPVLDLFWVNQEIHRAAMSFVMTINRRKLSLVDCSSFEIIRSLQIENVFTFDPHFLEQGFKIIPN